MNKNIFKKVHRINYLIAEMDALYHQASLKIGLADSAMRVLYAIYGNGNCCMLSDIYKQSGISKQTINSAIRKLEDEDIIYLEQFKGRTKKVFLTDNGKDYVKYNVALLYEAESNAFESWTEDELNTHIHLMEKYVESFCQQIRKL